MDVTEKRETVQKAQEAMPIQPEGSNPQPHANTAMQLPDPSQLTGSQLRSLHWWQQPTVSWITY